ncbi:hypothetical protein [Dictyobacter formicarum]|uniref:Lipocalin-like domain-containing protein n=1 Tax=Dictyobacter formicarum TaxID=2778368 RepID=A0ABQ3VNR5_9CHLR|nr:hypothetical protein [Dictyobacter formicarum]GHO87887.1 hypothetical protein KSZ_58930 [Dictyobacter formicarum]
MKKGTRVPSTKYRADRFRAPQIHSRSKIKWVAICAISVVAFICFIGIASAAQMSGGPGAARIKEQNVQKLIDAGRAHMHQKGGSQNQAPAAQPAPTRQAGIVSMRQGPFPASVFTVRNMWQGPVGSDWVLAYAGAKTNPDSTPGTGGIVLYTETVNAQGAFDLHPLKTFLAPNGTTTLTITATNGNLLLLRSQNGTQLTFNLVTHQFH